MYKCSITACDEKNVFIGHIYEMGDTIEEAKDKASTRCQKLSEKQPVAYASVTVTDNDGNYVDSDEFTLRNGELDLSDEGNPRVGISIVELWEYLKGKKTADGAEIVVTPNQPDYWDGSWPAPDDFATGEAYFDLKKAGELLCCDGEECVCYFDPEKDMYVCHNEESNLTFLLTKEEFGICTFRPIHEKENY